MASTISTNDYLRSDRPALILAPMDGVTDAPLREFLSRTGFYDYTVSEFIRVSEHIIPEKTFRNDLPELQTNAKTASGIAVQVQILGGNPERMAQSAINAIKAGAKAIDINFGCPAPTVNRNDGGATLLKYPERVEAIVRAVRDAVPSSFPVSAKMRLGFENPNAIFENAQRAQAGGASWITIHGRTKTQGYTPPAYWLPIGKVKASLHIPVVANGEIFSLDDFKRCRDETGCLHFMLGRAALSLPHLAGEIRNEMGLPLRPVANRMSLPSDVMRETWRRIFSEYALVQPSEKRVKQWVGYLARKRSVEWWDEIKPLKTTSEILNRLAQPAQADSASP